MSISLKPVRDELNVRPGRLFIGGSWRDWAGERFDQIHPATNEVMTSFPEAGTRGVDEAVAAARRAFDEGSWPRMSAQDRKRMLQPIVERIYAAEKEIAQLQTLDNGIPFTFSRNSRVSGKAAADIFDHFLGWIDKINGETYPQFSSASNMQYMSFREPVGVVAAILTWNGPVMTFAMKVAPALACGCTVVVKPSEYTNLAVLKLAEIIAESDLPPGVFNLVTGGAETGAALSAHPGVDIFFRSDPSLPTPDLQVSFTPGSYREGLPGLLDHYPGMTLGGHKQRPESRGYVKAQSTSIDVDPVIQPNYLATESDQKAIVAVVRMARAVLQARPFAEYYVDEIFPGDDVRTDDEILDFARQRGGTVYHHNGTARMGPDSDPDAVVDARLRVRGVEGLRVADASIMPAPISGPTNASTIMIGEKAADMILQDAARPLRQGVEHPSNRGGSVGVSEASTSSH